MEQTYTRSEIIDAVKRVRKNWDSDDIDNEVRPNTAHRIGAVNVLKYLD